MMKKTKTLAVLLLAGAAVSTQAQTSLTWDWTYQPIAFNGPASGTLTTQSTLSTNATSGAVGFLITGITGTWDGAFSGPNTITSLVAPSPDNDDMLLSANTNLWQLSDYGVGFDISNGQSVDIFSGGNGTGPTYVDFTANCYVTYDEVGEGGTYANKFEATEVSPVPEPSTLALAGLGMAACLILRQRS